METDTDDAIREEIHRRAAARAEATVYSLNHRYLSDSEKAKVEAVYQFPLGVMHYAFSYFALWLTYPVWKAWLAASGIGIVAWMMARFFSGHVFWPIGLLFGGNTSTLVCIGLAITAGVMGLYGAMVYLVLASIGVTAIIEPPMWLWSATRKMNPKYQIAKRMFGVTFPFEKDL